ncbi:hypothetical protein CsSME_00051357 [Camellia sinensis var. sinensis]
MEAELVYIGSNVVDDMLINWVSSGLLPPFPQEYPILVLWRIIVSSML